MPEAGDEVFLYELYDNEPAFRKHLAADHFVSFDAATRHMILDKLIRRFELLGGPAD